MRCCKRLSDISPNLIAQSRIQSVAALRRRQCVSLPESRHSIPGAQSAIPATGFLSANIAPRRTSPLAFGTAAVINAGMLVLILLFGMHVMPPSSLPPSIESAVPLDDFPIAVPALRAATGGGSGGDNQKISPIKGRPPQVAPNPILAPQPSVIDHPKLVTDPAIAADVKLPDNEKLPYFGVHHSVNVTLLSSGPGSHTGMGYNSGSGLGRGIGEGDGPGGPRGEDGGVYTPGVGGVTQPLPIYAPEAEFTDEARRHKYQGMCIISVIVDSKGLPHNLRVVRHLGMGLDEKALAAVAQYRFKPATRNGKPVAVHVDVVINFRFF